MLKVTQLIDGDLGFEARYAFNALKLLLIMPLSVIFYPFLNDLVRNQGHLHSLCA